MINKIYIELPLAWIDNKNAKHKIFLSNFLLSLSKKKIPISCLPTEYPSYGVQRTAIKNSILFSFHSYDNPDNVWTYKESPIVNLYSIDKNGYTGWGDIILNPSKYRDRVNKISIKDANKIIDEYKLLFESTGDSKYQQSTKEYKLPSKYVFFPLQVRNDSAATHENIDLLTVIEKAAEIAKEQRIHLVLKRHPYCNSEAIKMLIRHLEIENPYVICVDANIHYLIKNSLFVLSCNSGVSLEALIDGKAVYCFGKSEWYDACNKIESIDDLNKAFYSPPTFMSDFQKKLIAFLLSEYWVRYDDIKRIDDKIDEVLSCFLNDYGIAENNEDVHEFYSLKILDIQANLSEIQNDNILMKKDYSHLKKSIKKMRINPFAALGYLIKRAAVKIFKLNY